MSAVSDLVANLQNIQTEIDTKLIASNIRKGVTIFGVTGTYEGEEPSL